MGRGRAKAKQTKVARELKYRSYETDLDALQRELAGREEAGNGDTGSDSDVDEPDQDDDERIARRL
ncbi:DUF3073 domain-containing protein [Tenggerimyces flavus]|uniref:DUF3073 domain-containing protein n=1 Tax=Tenggerimyces flavus TaxID=1708749 RepID=A0ABV7YFR3_9ACTN|nr:DUF3073 domain-containing protein [Tenggerimyces flavus]MBM7783965.1 phage replication-related protein YjqB (UPF0714/DUF867 family) [Tenggerimyces flavus]